MHGSYGFGNNRVEKTLQGLATSPTWGKGGNHRLKFVPTGDMLVIWDRSTQESNHVFFLGIALTQNIEVISTSCVTCSPEKNKTCPSSEKKITMTDVVAKSDPLRPRLASASASCFCLGNSVERFHVGCLLFSADVRKFAPEKLMSEALHKLYQLMVSC